MDILKGLSNSVLDKIFQYGLTSLQCQRIATKETDYIGIPLAYGSITNSGGTPTIKKLPGTDTIEITDKLSRTKFQRISSRETQDKFSHHVMRVVDIVHNKKIAHNDSDCYSNVSCAGDVLVTPNNCEGNAALNSTKVKVERTDNMNGNTNATNRVSLKATRSNEKPIEVKDRTVTQCTDILECNTNFDRCAVKSEPNGTVVSIDIAMHDASKQKSDGSVFNTEFRVVNVKTENIEQEDVNSMRVSKLQISKVNSKSQIEQPNGTVDKSNQTCCVSKDDKQITQQATNNIIPNVHTKDAVITDNNTNSTEQQPMYDEVPDCMNKLESHSDKNETGYRNISSLQAEVYIDVDLDGNNNCVNDNIVINDILKYKHTSPDTAHCTDVQEQYNLDVSDKLCLSFASEESSDSFLDEPVKFLNTGTDLKKSGEGKSDITSGKTQQIVNKQNSNGNNVIGIKNTQSTDRTMSNIKLMNARVILRKCDADIRYLNLQKAKHRCENDARSSNTPFIRMKSIDIDSVSSNDKEKEKRKCESTKKKNMDTAHNAKVCSNKTSKHLDKREERKRNESRKYKSMSDKNGKNSSSDKKTSDLYMEDSDKVVKANKAETIKANVKSNEKDSTGHRLSEKNVDEHAIKNMPAEEKPQKGVKLKNGSLKGIVEEISDKQDTKNTNTDKVTFIQKGLSVNENKEKEENSKPLSDTNKSTLAVRLTTKTQIVFKDIRPEEDDNKGIKTHRTDKAVCFNENSRVNGKCKGHARDKEACSKFSKTRKRRHSSVDEGFIHRNHKKIKRISDEINDKKKERKGSSNEKHNGNKKAVVICNEHKKTKTKPPKPNVLNSDTRERILEWLAAGVEMEHGQSYCTNDTKIKSLQNKIGFKIPKKDRDVEKGKSDAEISPKDKAKVNIADGNKPKQSDKKHHSCEKIEKESKVEEAKEKRIHSCELRISKNNERKHTTNVSTIETTGVKPIGLMNEDKVVEEERNTSVTCLTKPPQQNHVYMKCDRKASSTCGSSKNTPDKGSEIKTSNKTSAEKVRKRHRQESENSDRKTMSANKTAKYTNQVSYMRSLDKNEGKIMSVTGSSDKKDKTVDISCERKCRDMEHTSAIHDIQSAKVGISVPHVPNSATDIDKDMKSNTLVLPKEFDIHNDQTEGDESADINNNQKHVFNDNETMNDSETMHGKNTKNNGVNDKQIKNAQNIHCVIDNRNKYQQKHRCITCKKAFSKCLEGLKKHKVKCISTVKGADRELNFNEIKTNVDCNRNSPNANKVPVGCEGVSREIRTLNGSSSTVFRSISLKECKNDSRNMDIRGQSGKENIEISINITDQREHIQMNNQSLTHYVPKVNISSGRMVRCENCKKAWYSNKYDFKCHQKRCDALNTTKDCAHNSKRDNSNWVRQYPMALKYVPTSTDISNKNVNPAEVKNKKATFVSSVVRQIGPEIQKNKFGDSHRDCSVLATVKRTEMCRICKGAYFRSKKELHRHVNICKHKMKLEANKWRS